MADKNLHLTVITPAKAVFDADAISVVAPAFDGEMGVLPGHAAMLALLGNGELRVTTASGVKKLAVRGGFLQVNQNRVTVLTPEGVSADEIQPNAIQAEIEKLNTEKPTKPADREAWENRLAWARVKQKIKS